MNDGMAWAVVLTMVAQIVVIGGFLWRIASAMADIRIKVDLMWEQFQRTQLRGADDGR